MVKLWNKEYNKEYNLKKCFVYPQVVHGALSIGCLRHSGHQFPPLAHPPSSSLFQFWSVFLTLRSWIFKIIFYLLVCCYLAAKIRALSQLTSRWKGCKHLAPFEGFNTTIEQHVKCFKIIVSEISDRQWMNASHVDWPL